MSNPKVDNRADSAKPEPSQDGEGWYKFYKPPPSPSSSFQRRSDGRRGEGRRQRRRGGGGPSKRNQLARTKPSILPEFTGSAAGGAMDRHENPLYQVPINADGAVSFGNWPYPGKGLYGLGYNYKPIAAVVMPTLLIAGLALLYPGVINAARYGRKKRSVTPGFPDESEYELDSIHKGFLAATEACWKRFACESQAAVRKNQLVKEVLRAVVGPTEEDLAPEARTEDEDDLLCSQYECDILSDIFGS